MKISSKTHQIAPFKIFWGKHAPNPLANAWLPHVLQAALRHATRPAPQKVAHLGKSYVRPWTTTKKFIWGDALVESTLVDSWLCVVRYMSICITKSFNLT